MDKQKVFRKIKLLLAEDKYDEAVITALSGYKEFKDICFINEIANIYISTDKRKDAIKCLERIYKLDPNNLSNIKRLAYNYFANNNFKKALKYYKLVLDFEPQVSKNYFNIGSMYHFLIK